MKSPRRYQIVTYKVTKLRKKINFITINRIFTINKICYLKNIVIDCCFICGIMAIYNNFEDNN